jgi:hypothetical protein
MVPSYGYLMHEVNRAWWCASSLAEAFLGGNSPTAGFVGVRDSNP